MYGAFTLFGCPFQAPSTRLVICNSLAGLQTGRATSRNPDKATLAGLTPSRFGLIRVRSPLLTESLLLSLPGGTEMVHFPPFASQSYVFTLRWQGMTPAGFPHSEILGSKLVCSSPRLIAACHVLHRLSAPRHPPCTLNSLTKLVTSCSAFAPP